jgi:hypothetical protein
MENAECAKNISSAKSLHRRINSLEIALIIILQTGGNWGNTKNHKTRLLLKVFFVDEKSGMMTFVEGMRRTEEFYTLRLNGQQ